MLKRLFSNSQRNLGFADSRSEGRTSIAFCTETILYVYDESSQIPVEAEGMDGEWEDGALLLSTNMISAKTITMCIIQALSIMSLHTLKETGH